MLNKNSGNSGNIASNNDSLHYKKKETGDLIAKNNGKKPLNCSVNINATLALDYIDSTNTTVFLTGKAGTGKTTLLQQIKRESKKKLAVVAPTGVAAINAGGMTIHSFFQLPFGPLLPGGDDRPEVHYSPEKRALLYNLELLIIDEISMVRPDVLDQVDLILRNIKESNHPFGGVQLLLIGDLSQLSPIIREEEWAMLSRYYNNPYFFGSQVLQKTPYVVIELDHVYRQKEQGFVDILNEVRNQNISTENLTLLNERYRPDFSPDEPYITLTTHNSIAGKINAEYLEALTGEPTVFTATIRGDFPKDAYPTETELQLKAGAQVMFVKNDGSAEKLYYNGKIGTLSRIEGNTVYVECGSEKELAVEAVEWSNIKYQLNGEQISETNAGSFAQLPLKLAWAITIHKSQGLTFDKAIIDVSEAFAHGQAYVALSRCRSLSGMILRNPIFAHNIIGDPTVVRYNEQARQNIADLDVDRGKYAAFLLAELFNFSGLKNRLGNFENLIDSGFIAVAVKTARQLKPGETDRIQKAATYFLIALRQAAETLHGQIPELIGKSKEGAAKADQLLGWIMSRISLMDHFNVHEFNADAYRNATLAVPKPEQRYTKALYARINEKLYEQLIAWRQSAGDKEQLMPSGILTDRTLDSIAERLPATIKALGAIKGVGPMKAQLYGAAIISMIRVYQQELYGKGSEQVNLF